MINRLIENKGKALGNGKIEQTVKIQNDNGTATGKYIVNQKTGKFTPIAVTYKEKKGR